MARIIPIPIGPIYNEGSCRGMVHVVEKGDTLYRLGKQYHVSVGQLMFANPFVNVYNLQVGDELCIPISIQPRNPEGRMQGELMQDAGMGPVPVQDGAAGMAEPVPAEDAEPGPVLEPQGEI